MSRLRNFLHWFTGKDQLTKDQVKEAISDLAPPPQSAPPIRTIQDLRAAQEIRTLQDLTAFSEEVRKTLTIMKHTSQNLRDNHDVFKRSIDLLYVEVGNINDKIRALAPRIVRNKAASQEKLSKET